MTIDEIIDILFEANKNDDYNKVMTHQNILCEINEIDYQHETFDEFTKNNFDRLL